MAGAVTTHHMHSGTRRMARTQDYTPRGGIRGYTRGGGAARTAAAAVGTRDSMSQRSGRGGAQAPARAAAACAAAAAGVGRGVEEGPLVPRLAAAVDDPRVDDQHATLGRAPRRRPRRTYAGAASARRPRLRRRRPRRRQPAAPPSPISRGIASPIMSSSSSSSAPAAAGSAPRRRSAAYVAAEAGSNAVDLHVDHVDGRLERCLVAIEHRARRVEHRAQLGATLSARPRLSTDAAETENGVRRSVEPLPDEARAAAAAATSAAR